MNKQAKRFRRKLILFANLFLWSIVAIALLLITQPMSSPSLILQASTKVSPASLQLHVKTLSETFSPRDYLNSVNLDRSAAYIKSEFERTSGQISEQLFDARGKTYRNIIAVYGPKSAERIVVGAHYDVCQPMPGARP